MAEYERYDSTCCASCSNRTLIKLKRFFYIFTHNNNMSDLSYEDWEDRAADMSDDEDIPETKFEPAPESPVEEKSTKNMEHAEIDDMFSSMAEVIRTDTNKLGLPEDFSLKTETDFSKFGEYIAMILEQNGDKKKTYKFFRSLFDKGIKNLDDTSLAECKSSFMVEMNERTRNKRVKKKPKKKKAGIRMDNSNYDSSRYDDTASFADF